MPSYKTHAIHGEMILPFIDKKVDIDLEDLKIFCMGPDLLAPTNTSLFRLQHTSKTKDYFMRLINLIKENKLQYNKEVMAFLYGQLEHFILDVIIHPLVYYMTIGMPNNHIVNSHGLLEHLIDDYVMNKYDLGKNSYFKKTIINDNSTYTLINNLYRDVFNTPNIGIQYNAGIIATLLYESTVRNDKTNIVCTITNLINLGDVKYHDENDLAIPYLNLDCDEWLNPETGVIYNFSFDDLWYRANELLLEIIYDVNNYIYLDKPLNNILILNNTSYLTGLPCEMGQTKKYYKVYKKSS